MDETATRPMLVGVIRATSGGSMYTALEYLPNEVGTQRGLGKGSITLFAWSDGVVTWTDTRA